DGIRDLIVTGVQTCALPICLALGITASEFGVDDVPEEPAGIIATRGRKARIFLTFSRLLWQIAAADERLRLTPGIGDSSLAHERSEERRVGKECRRAGATGQ